MCIMLDQTNDYLVQYHNCYTVIVINFLAPGALLLFRLLRENKRLKI